MKDGKKIALEDGKKDGKTSVINGSATKRLAGESRKPRADKGKASAMPTAEPARADRQHPPTASKPTVGEALVAGGVVKAGTDAGVLSGNELYPDDFEDCSDSDGEIGSVTSYQMKMRRRSGLMESSFLSCRSLTKSAAAWAGAPSRP